MSRRLSICIPFCLVMTIASSAAPPLISETLAVMQAALSGELAAGARYAAYARRADEEGHPRLAYFSLALSASEGIHARNFQNVMKDLGATPDLSVAKPEVGDTQANLRNASQVELAEIDTRYPQFLKRLEKEGQPRAIAVLTFAWNAEKQHRELITQIISGSGVFFGILARKFEDRPVDYFVCQNCGSTLAGADLPKEHCPICSGPAKGYVKIDPQI